MNTVDMTKQLKDKVLKDSEGRRDICTVYSDKALMDAIIEHLSSNFVGKIDYVAAPESLGFILGSLMSSALGVGFIPIRNGEVAVLEAKDSIRSYYIDHRDRARKLQVRKSNIPTGSRILLVDDWVESGATIHACKDIIDEAGAILVGVAAIGSSNTERMAKFEEDNQFAYIIKD